MPTSSVVLPYATWLVKSEPSTYSWQTLCHEGRTPWDGVRNHQAKKNLQTMALGDVALFYHSMSDKAIVGLCRVVRTAYPDPTDPNGPWFAVDMAPLCPLPTPVTLASIKATPTLASLPLVTQGRLSVMPITHAAFMALCGRGGLTLEALANVTGSQRS
jgi:predicted RNA-binding protein with PUA-like domain